MESRDTGSLESVIAMFETWSEENGKEAVSFSQKPAQRLAEAFCSEEDELKHQVYFSILENFTKTLEFFEEFIAQQWCNILLFANLHAARLHSSLILKGNTSRQLGSASVIIF